MTFSGNSNGMAPDLAHGAPTEEGAVKMVVHRTGANVQSPNDTLHTIGSATTEALPLSRPPNYKCSDPPAGKGFHSSTIATLPTQLDLQADSPSLPSTPYCEECFYCPDCSSASDCESCADCDSYRDCKDCFDLKDTMDSFTEQTNSFTPYGSNPFLSGLLHSDGSIFDIDEVPEHPSGNHASHVNHHPIVLNQDSFLEYDNSQWSLGPGSNSSGGWNAPATWQSAELDSTAGIDPSLTAINNTDEAAVISAGPVDDDSLFSGIGGQFGSNTYDNLAIPDNLPEPGSDLDIEAMMAECRSVRRDGAKILAAASLPPLLVISTSGYFPAATEAPYQARPCEGQFYIQTEPSNCAHAEAEAANSLALDMPGPSPIVSNLGYYSADARAPYQAQPSHGQIDFSAQFPVVSNSGYVSAITGALHQAQPYEGQFDILAPTYNPVGYPSQATPAFASAPTNTGNPYDTAASSTSNTTTTTTTNTSRTKKPGQAKEKTLKQCPTCAKTFGDSSALSKHKRTHEGANRLFDCSYCEKRFNRPDQLKRHVRRGGNKAKPACKALHDPNRQVAWVDGGDIVAGDHYQIPADFKAELQRRHRGRHGQQGRGVRPNAHYPGSGSGARA